LPSTNIWKVTPAAPSSKRSATTAARMTAWDRPWPFATSATAPLRWLARVPLTPTPKESPEQQTQK
jgi:hypothetical protein